ncbi:MAG: adenylate/guanylate cyclase domain-containing protein [Actinomycetota bacterium]
MSQQTIEDPVAAARQAADRHAWQEAYDLLSILDREGGLDGAGLELLGSIAWWAGHAEESTEARERAFAAYLKEGDRARAAHLALVVARDHGMRLSSAVAQGWRARARRILEEEPESFAHGYLALTDASRAIDQGEFDRAAEQAARGVDIGARSGDRDLQAYGLMYQGMALVRRGDIEEGLSLLDEATAAAVGGELSPYATGIVYCNTISTCRDLADYRRAGEWTEVAKRWCERQSISGFPGVCRVHRAEILALRGGWAEAEEEAKLASKELMSFKALPLAAEGFNAVGEVRLRMGDLEGAEEAFREAQDLGHDPQPGLALLHLAQGRVDAAISSIRTALAGPASERLGRARLLPSQVEIAIEAGDLEVARAAAEELTAIASDFGSPALHAAAHGARGAVLVATGEAEEALREFGLARKHWQETEAPYEVARARMGVAAAHRLLGALEDAALELEAARSAFVRLGAVLDASRCDRMLAELRGQAERGERVRRTFVFTDIVGSTELMSVIGDEAWEDVRRWHDQTLRALVARHGGQEVNHVGDGFFLSFPDPRSAVECAVAIQRALAEHRRKAGFAPRVRIGLHASDATMSRDGYLGQGVHQAARIGALAGPGEIVASGETLNDGVGYPVGEPLLVELKGIADSVEVRTIRWSPSEG